MELVQSFKAGWKINQNDEGIVKVLFLAVEKKEKSCRKIGSAINGHIWGSTKMQKAAGVEIRKLKLFWKFQIFFYDQLQLFFFIC